MIRHGLWISALLTLTACTSSPPPQGSAQDSPAAHSGSTFAAVQSKVPWSRALKDEQRARDVQKLINQHAKKQRAQIEKETH
ncbi:MAG TPA: hypothetical protein ENI75_02320 [Mizugakiibacter sp.]|nr:hypothetical protein [Mizugakiibacter sp.]